ncbi:hypothetical protein EV715DRAFT_251791 [Schizophyllum commune]
MTANTHLDPYLPYPAQVYPHSPDASRPVARPPVHAFNNALPPLGTENFPDKARYLNHRHDQQRARDQHAGTQAEDYALPPSVVGLQPPYPHVIQPPSAARDGAYSAFSAPYPVAHPPSMPEARRVDERRFIDRESPAARDARFLAPLPPVPPPEPRVAQLESPPPQRSPAVAQTTIPLESAGTSTERDATLSRAQPSSSRSSANTRRASTNVVIACKQCRQRKIKCDSTRPSCHNCKKRENPCEYDPVPKRRGPDKRPGTRQRACGKRPREDDGDRDPKRRRFDDSLTIIAEPGSAPLTDYAVVASRAADYTRSPTDYKPPIAPEYPPPPNDYPPAPPDFAPSSPYHSRLAPVTGALARDQNAQLEPTFSRRAGARGSSSTNSRALDKTTSRLSVLTVPTSPLEGRPPQPESSRRRQRAGSMAQAGNSEWWARFLSAEFSLEEIRNNFTYLFRANAPHWLSFLHLESFFDDLYDDEIRPSIQPAFVLAALALAILMRSSEAEWGAQGREKALHYRNTARAHMDSAIHIDLRLAEAAVILAVFELSLHPQYSPSEFPRALQDADRLIAGLGLCARDAADPDIVRFAPRQVPTVPGGRVSANSPRGCRCADAVAVTGWPAYTRSQEDRRNITDEESRRLCWAAVSLAAEHAAECAAFGRKVPRYFVGEAANLTILFPSETTDRANPVFRSADAPTQKETLSALYCRSMVLWQFVVRLGEAGGMLSQKATPRVDQEGAWMGQEGSFPSATPFSPTPGPFSPTSAPGTRDGGAWASEPRGAWPSAAGPSRSGENWSSERLRRDGGLQLQQINRTTLERDSQTTVRPDSPWTPDEQVEAAQEAFEEAQAIEDALDLHTCVDDLGRPAGDADVVHVYLTREHIFNVRTTVSLVLRRLQGLAPPALSPFPSRRQAEDWIEYQQEAIGRLGITAPPEAPLHGIARIELAHRPFAAPWLANQLELTLSLIRQDRTLEGALNLAHDLLRAMLLARDLWPIPAYDERYVRLKSKVREVINDLGAA